MTLERHGQRCQSRRARYRFVYGTSPSYGQTTTAADLAAAPGATPVSAPLTGLAAEHHVPLRAARDDERGRDGRRRRHLHHRACSRPGAAQPGARRLEARLRVGGQPAQGHAARLGHPQAAATVRVRLVRQGRQGASQPAPWRCPPAPSRAACAAGDAAAGPLPPGVAERARSSSPRPLTLAAPSAGRRRPGVRLGASAAARRRRRCRRAGTCSGRASASRRCPRAARSRCAGSAPAAPFGPVGRQARERTVDVFVTRTGEPGARRVAGGARVGGVLVAVARVRLHA